MHNGNGTAETNSLQRRDEGTAPSPSQALMAGSMK